MNSGNCDAFIIRRNHIHHTGLRENGTTEGEGMYIGCHDGGCITTNSLIEGNHIHHLRGVGSGGNDGIEVKYGSYNNTIRNNVIHDTNITTRYPGIFVYGGGSAVNIVEGNKIWNAGEGIQVVSDAVIRNNVIFDCTISGITAAPHAAVPHVRNVRIVNNTIVNHPVGVRIRWSKAADMVFGNSVFCPDDCLDASGATAPATAQPHLRQIGRRSTMGPRWRVARQRCSPSGTTTATPDFVRRAMPIRTWRRRRTSAVRFGSRLSTWERTKSREKRRQNRCREVLEASPYFRPFFGLSRNCRSSAWPRRSSGFTALGFIQTR
jgi:hypothetical protein